MIVCPVCEHPQQQGDACDVCGMRLAASAPAAALPDMAMPELERTILPPVAVAATLMPELDLGRAPQVEVAPEVVQDVEATCRPPVDEVPMAAPADLERTNLADDGVRTALPASLTCRYCGHVQARTHRLCEKCANALPVLMRAQAVAKAGPNVRCPSCGTQGEAGTQCPACGFALKFPGE